MSNFSEKQVALLRAAVGMDTCTLRVLATALGVCPQTGKNVCPQTVKNRMIPLVRRGAVRRIDEPRPFYQLTQYGRYIAGVDVCEVYRG